MDRLVKRSQIHEFEYRGRGEKELRWYRPQKVLAVDFILKLKLYALSGKWESRQLPARVSEGHIRTHAKTQSIGTQLPGLEPRQGQR